MPGAPLPSGPLAVAYVEHNAKMGGSVLSLRSLLEGLRGRVKPVVLQFANVEFDDLIGGIGVKTITVPFEAFDYRKANPYASLGRLGVELFVFRKYVTYTLPLIVVFYRLFRRHRPALIHLNNHVYAHRSELIAARMAGIPCVCHLREIRTCLHPLDLWAGRFASRFIAISEAVRNAAIEAGLPPDRVRTVYNGIDFEQTATRSKDRDAKVSVRVKLGLDPNLTYIISLGRLVEWKGVDHLIGIWPDILSACPNARLLVLGDGPAKESLQHLARSNGSERVIQFVGFVHDIWDYLSAGDIYVHCGRQPEPFGRSIVEAMGMGLAVVAPAWGSTSELIEHGVSGLVYEPLNTEGLRQAVIDVVNDPALRQRLAAQAELQARRRFGMAQYVEGVWGVYREVLNERGLHE